MIDMKTLMIERVSNGWIVRPFTARNDWACGSAVESPIAVYTRMEDLQADIPRLMEYPETLICAEISKNRHDDLQA